MANLCPVVECSVNNSVKTNTSATIDIALGVHRYTIVLGSVCVCPTRTSDRHFRITVVCYACVVTQPPEVLLFWWHFEHITL